MSGVVAVVGICKRCTERCNHLTWSTEEESGDTDEALL